MRVGMCVCVCVCVCGVGEKERVRERERKINKREREEQDGFLVASRATGVKRKRAAVHSGLRTVLRCERPRKATEYVTHARKEKKRVEISLKERETEETSKESKWQRT